VGEWSAHLLAKRREFGSPIRSFHGFFYVCCASSIVGVRIAGLIVLAQHKENERIGEAQKTISPSRFVIEPNNFAVLTRNGNMFLTRQWQIKNSK
jgi:hypothetical protein